MEAFLKLLSTFLMLFTVYSMASMSGLISEKSGIVNIGIEGTMVIGAAWFALMYGVLSPEMNSVLKLLISLSVSISISALYIQLLSVATITFMSDHVIAGTGLNLLAPSLAILCSGLLTGKTSFIDKPNLDAFLHTTTYGYDFQMLFIWMAIIAIIILLIGAYILNKTRMGLRLETAGENPYALEASMVSVTSVRYKAIFIAGLLAGFAGSVYAMDAQFYFTVKGSGFIALGILIFGQWTFRGITIGSALIASLISIFQNWVFAFGLNPQTGVLMSAIPFIIPLIGLLIFKSSNGPTAVGKPFRKDVRK